jgi:glycosyltransferase involved in cell wall biosynthesis
MNRRGNEFIPISSETTMKIVIIEAAPIRPENDAGSRALLDIYLSSQELGHETCFLFESEINLKESLSSIKPDVIFVSRPGLYQRTHPIYKSLKCKIIYIAHDLHFERLSLQRKLLGGLSSVASELMRIVEKYCILTSDVTIFPTLDEAKYANELFETDKAISLNYFRFEEIAPRKHNGEISRLIFVGGSDHKPNQDGINWFVNNVFEEIRIEFPSIQLFIVGRWSQEIQEPLQQNGITFTGLLSESDLFNLMNESDVGIAPLRFGAGMKRKVLNYMAHGIPVVSTSYGVQGLNPALKNGVELARSPEEWISAIRLLNDRNYRTEQALAASKFISDNFSVQHHRTELARLLELVENR